MNQPNTDQGDNVQSGGHPAWQEYLKDIPAAIHPVVQAAFQKWDANVQQRLQEVHTQYAPLKVYQPLADNKIPIQYVGQALQFATELEQDPKAWVAKVNTQLDLGFVPLEEVQRQAQASPDPFSDDFSDEVDITQHPKFKEMFEMMSQMQERVNQQDQQSQEEKEAAEFYEYLDDLVAETPFKDDEDAKMLITAFMSQGLEGPEALAKIQGKFVQSLANNAEQNLNNEQPQSSGNPLVDAVMAQINPVATDPVGYAEPEGQAPVVMGNSGNAGSGVPAQPIDFGAMKTDDINSVVAQALQQTAENG